MPLNDTPIFTRSFADADLSVRGDGRTIYGLAVPFDTPTPVRDREGTYSESFQRGAFAQTINGGALRRVKLFVKHDRQAVPIGVAVELTEDAAGLIAGLRVSKTSAGDEIIELVRDGALDQLSVGFRPVHTMWSDIGALVGPRSAPASDATATRTEVRLDEVSVVDFAAYPTAEIAGIRSTTEDTPDGAVDVAAAATIEAADGTSWESIIRERELRKRLDTFLRGAEQ